MANATYKDIRALGRGLAVLEAMARRGWVLPVDLSVETGIDRGTVYRVLYTLDKLGYASKRSEDGAYGLTRKINAISAGIRPDDLTLNVVGSHLQSLVKEIGWPSDFARLSRGRLVIEESNHSLSPMTFHRGTIGQERSLLTSALGKAVLSIMDPSETASSNELGGLSEGDDVRAIRYAVRRIRDEVDGLGYASAIGAFDTNVSAIALPMRCLGQPCALNVVFFRSSMSPSQAAQKLLPALRECAQSILKDLGDTTIV